MATERYSGVCNFINKADMMLGVGIVQTYVLEASPTPEPYEYEMGFGNTVLEVEGLKIHGSLDQDGRIGPGLSWSFAIDDSLDPTAVYAIEGRLAELCLEMNTSGPSPIV